MPKRMLVELVLSRDNDVRLLNLFVCLLACFTNHCFMSVPNDADD